MKNTYQEDFAFLEVMEPETGVLSDAITLANSGQDGEKSSAQKKNNALQSPKSSGAGKSHPLPSPAPTKAGQQQALPGVSPSSGNK